LVSKVRWEEYKARVCCETLSAADKTHHIVQYTQQYTHERWRK